MLYEDKEQNFMQDFVSQEASDFKGVVFEISSCGHCDDIIMKC